MYTITARIIRGHGRGAKLGFPTANLHIAKDMRLPPYGVYAAWAWAHGAWYRAAVSVGKNETFHATRDTIEAHILDFRGTLYGKSVTLVFVRRIRAMRRFSAMARLVRAIRQDIKKTKNVLWYVHRNH